MISRHWRGIASDTFPELRRIGGFVDASILRRAAKHGVEFLVVTRWRSMDACSA